MAWKHGGTLLIKCRALEVSAGDSRSNSSALMINQSQEDRNSSGLRRGSAATRLLGLRVGIPLGTWMFVSCECWVLSGRGFCDGPIPRPEESYRLWCVTVSDLQISSMMLPWPLFFGTQHRSHFHDSSSAKRIIFYAASQKRKFLNYEYMTAETWTKCSVLKRKLW
jgi:hypothetical protein